MSADIRVVDGRLVYGLEDCRCTDGKVFGKMACPACKGTGRTKGGLGKGACRKCLFGTVVDLDPAHRVTCEQCNGARKIQSNSCSYVPIELYYSLPFRVYRSARPQSWNEAWLGHGTVFSVTDYGRHKSLSDEQLIAEARGKDHSIQACKIANSDGKLCGYVGIYCNDEGYSLIAVYE
jgi:hypothetical protein